MCADSHEITFLMHVCVHVFIYSCTYTCTFIETDTHAYKSNSSLVGSSLGWVQKASCPLDVCELTHGFRVGKPWTSEVFLGYMYM